LPSAPVSPNSPFSINPCPKYGSDKSASTSFDRRADNPRFAITRDFGLHGGGSSLERVNDHAARLLDALSQDITK